MRKGSFSVRNNVGHSTKHNNRELAPKYLIDSSAKNYYEQIFKDEEFINLAQDKYKEVIKQSMQKKQIPALIKEAVITIKEEQNENDIKDLFQELNSKYGGHNLIELAIHRDEGYFLKDDIAYYPTKNILKKVNGWYICSNPDIAKPKVDDFDKLVDINDFEKIYNYHAHAKFSMFDLETGKTARMNKSQMSSRIKFVSEYLDLDYAPDKTTSRIKKSVNQIKDEHLAKAREKESSKELAKQKDLKQEITKLREQLQQEQAKREDYAELEQLNRDLKVRIKAKDLTVSDLEEEIKLFKKEKEHLKSVIQVKDIEIIDLQNQNKALESEKNTLKEKVVELEEKIVSRPNMSDYDMEIELKKFIEANIETVEVKKSILKNEEISIIKPTNRFFNKVIDIVAKGYQSLKVKYKELRLRFDQLVQDYTKLENENANLDLAYKNLKQENKNLKEQLKEKEVPQNYSRRDNFSELDKLILDNKENDISNLRDLIKEEEEKSISNNRGISR